MSEIEELTAEFRRAYTAGEHPDASAFLARVPEAGREEMGRRIRTVLVEETPPDPAIETVLMVQAMLRGHPPLLELRAAKGMTRDEVVTGLRDELGLGSADDQRVAVYYHELETGQLPLAGIRDRVFDAVAKVLGVARASLLVQGPGPSSPGGSQAVFARSVDGTQAVWHSMASPALEPDNVDDLFTGGPG